MYGTPTGIQYACGHISQCECHTPNPNTCHALAINTGQMMPGCAVEWHHTTYFRANYVLILVSGRYSVARQWKYLITITKTINSLPAQSTQEVKQHQ